MEDNAHKWETEALCVHAHQDLPAHVAKNVTHALQTQ
jgi:hypothetical protein